MRMSMQCCSQCHSCASISLKLLNGERQNGSDIGSSSLASFYDFHHFVVSINSPHFPVRLRLSPSSDTYKRCFWSVTSRLSISLYREQGSCGRQGVVRMICLKPLNISAACGCNTKFIPPSRPTVVSVCYAVALHYRPVHLLKGVVWLFARWAVKTTRLTAVGCVDHGCDSFYLVETVCFGRMPFRM